MCHTAEGHRYTDAMPDQAFVDALEPAAEFSWRRMFPPQARVARDAGGVLLQEWLEVLTGAAARVVDCGAADADESRSDATRRLLQGGKGAKVSSKASGKGAGGVCSGALHAVLHARSSHAS